MYELTPFLTAIVAASASIVAILGGLIASKIISISNAKTSANERLKQIKEELNLHKNERDRLQAQDDEGNAFDFIRDHIRALINGEELMDVYNDGERQKLELETLSYYWDKAKNIFARYHSAMVEDRSELNDDNVPSILAQEYADDKFCYMVCMEIGQCMVKNQNVKEHNNPLLDFLPDYDALSSSISSTLAYGDGDNKKLIDEQNITIATLNVQKEQTENYISTLRKPNGMKTGLGIFAIFAVACIIFPLILIPCVTENYRIYLALKYGFLCAFIICLSCVFIYLIWLFKWEDKNQK